ncbi:MAG: MATE family efflux transporter [Roseibacillus sp.]|jgi:MATE family multidrug resistance protein
MQFFDQVTREARATVILALPLVIGQVSQMLIYLADTLMIGRLGTMPLAAATFANNVVHLPFMFGIGMSIAVSVRVAQARGAEEPEAARAALRHGLFITLAIGLATVLFALALIPFLPMFGQEAGVVEAGRTYFLIIAVSMIPGMASMAFKSHSDAMNRPWPAFWVILGGVVLNVFLNWIFIYGNLGAPRWELEGAGLATVLARSATLAGLIVLCLKLPAFKGWVPYRWFRRPDWRAVRDLVKIGLPTSLQILAESSAFVMATVIIGWMGANALAAHNVAMTCAAVIFMVPLGVSQALTVRIGEAMGSRSYHRWRPMVVSGWLLGIAFTVCSATAFVVANDSIARLFLPEEAETAAVVASLLLVAAAFQMGDALQILSAGGLRGLNDVNVPAWMAFVAYWAISIPLGWFFSFPLGMGVYGMWWGITVGLGLTAVTLGTRLWIKTGVNRFPKESMEAGDAK